MFILFLLILNFSFFFFMNKRMNHRIFNQASQKSGVNKKFTYVHVYKYIYLYIYLFTYTHIDIDRHVFLRVKAL